MANAKISKRTVDGAKPPKGNDAFLWDTELRRFGLRITPKGVKSYVIQYRMPGANSKRMTIGQHGSPWTPEEARKEAKKLLTGVDQGIDPVVQRKKAIHENRTQRFEDYVERFVEEYLKINRKRSWQSAKRQLENHAVPHLKGRTLSSIQRSDISAVFKDLRSQPATARNTFAVVRKMFRWAVNEGDLAINPIADMDPPALPPSRERLLLPDELHSLYHSTSYLSTVYGAWARMLILTLQRRTEVARMEWDEVDQREHRWIIPKHKTKNGRPHLVPLNDQAMAELDELGWKRRGFVFTTDGVTHIKGYSKAKAILDRELVAGLQDYRNGRADALGEDREPIKIAQWGLHDIRRTGTSQLQALGIPIEVTEKVINHVSGTTAGVAGVYNLYDYADEKRDALDRWGKYLAALIEEDEAKVVALAERRRA